MSANRAIAEGGNEIFAVVRASDGQLLAGMAVDKATAEAIAVVKAVNHGNVKLLSGLDLARWLEDWYGPTE